MSIQKSIPESDQSGQQTAPGVSGAMDPALKAKWVEALRSGEYKQGVGFLYDHATFGEDRYCCLGVLCKLQGADFAEIKSEFGTLSLCTNPSRYLGPITLAGERLAGMNDMGRSFPEIADYIEANIPVAQVQP